MTEEELAALERQARSEPGDAWARAFLALLEDFDCLRRAEVVTRSGLMYERRRP